MRSADSNIERAEHFSKPSAISLVTRLLFMGLKKAVKIKARFVGSDCDEKWKFRWSVKEIFLIEKLEFLIPLLKSFGVNGLSRNIARMTNILVNYLKISHKCDVVTRS